MGWYGPLTFTWSAAGLSNRATASKKSRVRVPGGVLRGPPDAIIATSDVEDAAGARRDGRLYRARHVRRYRLSRRHHEPDRAPLQGHATQGVGRGADLHAIEPQRDGADPARGIPRRIGRVDGGPPRRQLESASVVEQHQRRVGD